MYAVRSDRDLLDEGGATNARLRRFRAAPDRVGAHRRRPGRHAQRLAVRVAHGQVWGLPYRLLVAAVGIFVAVLSWTGVYLWWKKRGPVAGRFEPEGRGLRLGAAGAGCVSGRSRGGDKLAVPTFTTAWLRCSCWIAIFAMLALALLPSVSRALSAAAARATSKSARPRAFRLIAAADRGARTSRRGSRSGSKALPVVFAHAHALGMPRRPSRRCCWRPRPPALCRRRRRSSHGLQAARRPARALLNA